MSETFIVPSRGPNKAIGVIIEADNSGGVSGTPFNVYDEDTAVVSTTDTTILTRTVAAGKIDNIQGVVVSGSATGRFTVKVAGTTKFVTRTSAATRAEHINFNDGVIQATAAQDITVVAYHEEAANQTMQATLFGYTTDA